MNPAVSVLIINWNGRRYLGRCIEAVLAQDCQDFEILVVDNASSDGSVDGLEERYPGVRVIRSSDNLGFAAGNNLGARAARGKWLALLNNDAFPEPGWLAELLQAAARRPQFRFFACLLLRDADRQVVEATGDLYHASGNAWHRDLDCALAQLQTLESEVFSPSAAAALYDRQMFLDVGGFQEYFSSHYEDVDLGFRLRLRGERCLYVPGAVVAHVGSASYGVASDHTVFHGQRNRVWTYFTNMPGWLFWKYLPAHLLSNLIFLAYYTRRGQGKVILSAQWQALCGLPRALRLRRQVQHNRQASPAQVEQVMEKSLFGPYLLGRRRRRQQRR